jgi:hypothetical protein
MSSGQANPGITAQTSSLMRTIFPGDYAAADEGSFFTSTIAATASTAVATTTQVLAQANPTVAIYNSWASGGSPSPQNIYLRYIRLYMTVVTTGATSANHVGTLDPLTVKLTTIGTAMGTPSNVNSASGNGSRAILYAGVNVAAATSAGGRIVHTGTVTNSIPIVLDQWTLAFGEPAATGNLIGTMSLVKNVTISLPPVIIAPGWWYTLGFWGASWAASAPTYQIEVGWIERPSGQ